MAEDLDVRKNIAQQLLSAGIGPVDLMLQVSPAVLQQTQAAELAAKLTIPFPAGLEPTPVEINPPPSPEVKLPRADVVAITWTIDEQRALANVLTPGFSKDRWYRYNRKFDQYDPKIRPGAPAKNAQRLGSYFTTKIGGKTALCFKSELHLNQDGMETPPGAPGNATLPVKDLFHQIIDEVQPSHFITTGTAGAVFGEHDLGDVVVTRGAKFRVQREFRNSPFAGKSFKSNWIVPIKHFTTATTLMESFKGNVAEPPFGPPTVNFAPLNHLPKPIRPNNPDIKLDGRDMPDFHPILTTDYFEFGTSKNNLDQDGAAVEMGDAVLGLVVEELEQAGRPAPKWLVIRNCSDPQINGDLRDKPAKQSQQIMWAVYYYQGFGYWTSVMSALTTWAVIAGL